jgi:trimethylamine--corrinoid protein Co-methyltransferase
MAQFYDLPGGSAAGMADSKLPDISRAFEKGITNVMAGLSGLNLVYEIGGRCTPRSWASAWRA